MYSPGVTFQCTYLSGYSADPGLQRTSTADDHQTTSGLHLEFS